MKRGVTRQDFQNEIKKAIFSIGDREDVRETARAINEKGYGIGYATDIMEGNALLETLSLTELGVVAKAIYENTDIKTTRLDRFLEPAEIEVIQAHKKTSGTDEPDAIVFEDVVQVSHDIWSTVVPASVIANLYRSNSIGYDFEAQREPTYLDSEGIIPTPTVNWVAVEEIKDELVDGTFIPNTITFNVSPKHADSIKFDRKRSRLVITDKVLNILDGFHRSLGIVGAMREVGDLQYNFEVRITNFNVNKARQFIVQEDKRNPISKAYIKSIDEADEITVVVNQLNENTRSALRTLITPNHKLVLDGRALVTFDIIYSTIDALWDIPNFSEGDRLTNYLRQFFNELVSIYPEALRDNIYNERQKNSIGNEQTFVAYLTIAKELEGKDNWRNMLPRLLKDMEVSRGVSRSLQEKMPSALKRNKRMLNTEIGKIQERIRRIEWYEH